MFREKKLANGLEIIAEINPNSYSAAFGFFVKTGSRDETPEIAGVSHFLEHMVFKGTPKRSAADVNRELDEIGSHSNAYTSEEQTVYYATVLQEYQDHALDLLADIMRPSLRQEDFDTEKKVIIEEIYKYDDQPPFGAHEKCMAKFYGDHALGYSVLGSVESVTGLTPEAMRNYFQQRYSPGNITLVGCGQVDFDRMIAQAEELCGHWQAFDAPRDIQRPAVHHEFDLIHKPTATQEYVVQICDGPDATDPDRFANRVLAAIVGDDSGSRFYWEFIDSGLAEYAGLGPYEFQGAGITMTFLSCAPQDTDANLQRLMDVIRKVETEGVTQDELDLALSKICSQLVRQSERPSNRLFSVGNGWLQRHNYVTVKERVESYRAVTLADVHRVLEKFPLSQNTTVVVGPLEQAQRPK